MILNTPSWSSDLPGRWQEVCVEGGCALEREASTVACLPVFVAGFSCV